MRGRALKIIIILIIIGGGLITKVIYDKSSPSLIHLYPLGQKIIADKVSNMFIAVNNVYINQDTREDESNGIVHYLRIPVDASANTPYTLEKLTFDHKKYSLYGGITVASDGIMRLATRDLVLGGFAALVYSTNNSFQRAVHYDDNGVAVLQLYSGYYDSENFYFQVEYDSEDGGSLCKVPLNSTVPICYPHTMPPRYNGDFFVINQKLYYSNNLAVTAKNLLDNKEEQIGKPFDSINRGILPLSGLLGFYGGNVYIAALRVIGEINYPAICYVPIDSNSNMHWRCSYDKNIQIGNNLNITSFKIGSESTDIVIAITNYDDNTMQLYRLPIREILTKHH
jgi:hypothetical protein